MRTLDLHEMHAVSGGHFIIDLIPYFSNEDAFIRFACLCGSLTGGYYAAKLAYASYGVGAAIAGGLGGVVLTALLGPGVLLMTDKLVVRSMEFWDIDYNNLKTDHHV